MTPSTEETDSECEGMDTGVDADRPGEKSNLTKAIQGLIVFVVMFVVLYAFFSRLTDDERE